MWLEKLNSGDPETQQNAAYHLFVEAPDSVRNNSAAADSLRKLIEAPEPQPAALLLAAVASEGDIAGTIRTIKSRSGEAPVKLHPWSHPVAMRWIANLALSRLGDNDARNELLESIESASVDERLLILDAIQIIDDPTLLHQVAKYLTDSSEISRGVPSGAEPKRRLQDYAVDQLVTRLRLKVSFPLNNSGRYSAGQIEETRKLIRQSMPS